MSYSRLTSSDVEFLESVVGSENISGDPWELAIATSDELAGIEGEAEVIVWPTRKEQVARILEYCTKRRIPVTPRAGGSSTSGNATPIHGGIVLNMRRMNRILEVVPEDLLAVVEPGVVYEELNQRLRRYGLFFPPEPASSRICTIGGMVANNASGLRAVKYGVTRDYVSELEVVLPTGAIIRVGTRAPKSSIGYDLLRLFVGSEGTLGVFTEITIKLRPLPESRKSCLCYFDSEKKAAEAAISILRSTVYPSALEYLDSSALRILREEGYPYKEYGAALLIETDGSAREAEERIGKARGICESHEGTPESAENPKVWEGRKALGAILVRRSPALIKGDIDVPISKLPWIIKRAAELAGRYNVRTVAFGHVGDGNVHLNIITSKDNLEAAKSYYKHILEETVRIGGAISGEHGIGVSKREFMRLQHGDRVVEIMREIKRLFDPAWIMNPGKLV